MFRFIFFIFCIAIVVAAIAWLLKFLWGIDLGVISGIVNIFQRKKKRDANTYIDSREKEVMSAGQDYKSKKEKPKRRWWRHL